MDNKMTPEQVLLDADMAEDKTNEQARSKTGLALLREPFAEHQIAKLPKPTKRQTDEVKADFKKGIRCGDCGGWHHPKVVHLDYVGHAALTDRLLDADPAWVWEPLAVDDCGLPLIKGGGLWIKLTVCGVTRLGFGDAPGKQDATKEIIGDALRNAAMRFGAALDLWHKGDLHLPDDEDDEASQTASAPDTAKASKGNSRELFTELQAQLRAHKGEDDLKAWGKKNKPRIDMLPDDWSQKIFDEYGAEMRGLIEAREQTPATENGAQSYD